MFNFRMRHGLCWLNCTPRLKDFPTLIKMTKLLAISLACFSLVDSIEYGNEQALEAEYQAERAEEAERMVIDCLNGQARWLYDSEKLEGHGKTLITCPGVDELEL